MFLLVDRHGHPPVGGSAAVSCAKRARLRAKQFAGLPFPCRYQRPRHPRERGQLRPPTLTASTQRLHPPFTDPFSRRADMPLQRPSSPLPARSTSLLIDISLSWTRRRPRGHVRDPLGRTSQPFMGTRTRSTTPPASYPPLLIGHPLTIPPIQPRIPADPHRGRSPRTSADPGRNISRSRVRPRPAHTLAPAVQLYYPPRRGTPVVQSPRRSLVVGQGSPSRLDRQLFHQLLHRALPR